MTDLELHEFYENLVRTLRSMGVLCAITSGLACVHYGIAESTKDCSFVDSAKTRVVKDKPQAPLLSTGRWCSFAA